MDLIHSNNNFVAHKINDAKLNVGIKNKV